MTILGLLFTAHMSMGAGPVPVLNVPRPASLRMVAMEDVRRDESGVAPYRFAVGQTVDVTTANQGQWENLPNGQSVWRLQIVADGSTSLNFGFREFFMPRSGQLLISSANGRQTLRPFTAYDNEQHGQLWTPPLDGTAMNLEVRVATAERAQLRLRLGTINFGYRDHARRDFEAQLRSSGSCNIDVACNSNSMWTGPIHAVAAITVGGTDTCTGSLLNNTKMDRRMLFLTAYHCRITASNAPSVVAIWNYQNSNCRPPNSSASGGTGDGKRDQFSSGAIFRAGDAASDFTLVEMDDPAVPAFNLYWSGWNRGTEESPTLTGIHHPAVAEKRISFSSIASTTTAYLKNEVPGDGTHIRVTRWTQGTTEPGSSGSPLFDSHQRVIGQLHGGYAACNAMDTSDWYGRLSKSWEGGGTPTTRLKDWLDPANSNVMFMDGTALTSPFVRM